MEGRKTTVHTTRTETQILGVCDVTTKVHIPKPNHLGSVMLLLKYTYLNPITWGL